MTDNEMFEWLLSAQPGDRFEGLGNEVTLLQVIARRVRALEESSGSLSDNET